MAVDVLQAKIRKLKNPTMVCICPTIRELPLHIKEEARHKYGQTLRAAADAVIMKDVPEMGGDGGIIAVDANGNLTMPFNTVGMYRAWIKPDGSRGVAIFADEADPDQRANAAAVEPAKAH